MAMQEMDLEFEEFQGDVDSVMENPDNIIEDVAADEDNDTNGEEKDDDGGTIEIKKRVLKPQPKLNEARLTGDNGLPMVPKIFQHFQRDESKNEYENLDEVMGKLSHWAHCLFPKLKFDDFLARVEHLGNKRAVKTCMTKIRLDMPLVDGDYEEENLGETETEQDEMMEKEKSEIPKEKSSNHVADIPLDYNWDDDIDDIDVDRIEENTNMASSQPVDSCLNSSYHPTPSTSAISDEQKQRIEASRHKALELRQKRLQHFDNKAASKEIEQVSDSVASGLVAPDDVELSKNKAEEELFLTEDEIMADLLD